MDATKPVLLLDLGGVLADLGDPVTAMGLEMTLPEFWKTWTSSSVVRALETGQINEADFLRQIPGVLGCPDDDSFAPRFHAWQLRLFPGVESLIRENSRRFRIALLSNTNDIHWQQVASVTTMFDAFDHLFLSYETGSFKPDPAAFHNVMEFFDCAPGKIVFLDDSEPNIVAARALGIDARKVVGVEDLRGQLAHATV